MGLLRSLFGWWAVGSSAAVPPQLPLSRWPMIMTHDAATGYLPSGILHPINNWYVAQPSDEKSAITKQLNCGARAIDWRSRVDESTGGIVEGTHATMSVKHKLSDSLAEIVAWANAHPDDEDLVVFSVARCLGWSNCTDLTRRAVQQAGLAIVPCQTLASLTMGQALDTGRLPGGGHALAIVDGCLEMNWNETLSCSGYGSSKARLGAAVGTRPQGADIEEAVARAQGLARQGSELRTYYTCYGSSRDFPTARLFDYLDRTSVGGPPAAGGLWQMQALWQETKDSVEIGVLEVSSLLLDESKSGLNAQVTRAVAAGRWKDINLLEVNNVCDGGPELLAALRARPSPPPSALLV